MDIVSAVPVLGDHDHITRARQVLRDDAFREAYIVDAKGRCTGYIDITDALRVNATKSNVTLEGFVKTATVVNPEDTLETVAAAIIKSRTDSVAVVDTEGKLVGGILVSDLFPIVLSRHEPKGKVADCMSKKVVTADAKDPLQRVYTLIVESGYTAFPVLKKHALIGMISRRDLLDAGHARRSLNQSGAVSVEDLMTTPVISITPDRDIRTAAELLIKHDISRLPVEEDGTVIGILDRHDVLNGLKIKAEREL
jgi:CBS domain-containing protein